MPVVAKQDISAQFVKRSRLDRAVASYLEEATTGNLEELRDAYNDYRER